jgi:hypothetical protein
MPIAARVWNERPLIVVAQGAAALAVNMGINRFVYAPVPGPDPNRNWSKASTEATRWAPGRAAPCGAPAAS